ncbi:hypothetical protein L3V83_00115 [Thiotrichales bacterium 19X7-9]|nr:hypothetical protein [Thiotrichales bacterium 19X7-9]MCF6774961.1 hypothetical protein [Thiotrichales bacterium 19X7-9]
MDLNYQDRLTLLDKVIKTVNKRHDNTDETTNPLNIFLTEGHLSKLKHGNGAWVGVDFFPEWNYTRLLGLRLKQLADAITKALHSDALKSTIDKANPAISALGILWYFPRFLRHTALIVKHTKNSSNFDYARKHAFEWFNDLASITAGIITFGMSTGLYLAPLTSILGPGGIYLTVAIYGFDCLNQAIKSYQKIKKMNRIIKKIDNRIDSLCKDLNIHNDLNIINHIHILKTKNKEEKHWIKEEEQKIENDQTRLRYQSKLGLEIPNERFDELRSRKQELTLRKNTFIKNHSQHLKLQKLEFAIEMRERIKLKKCYTKREQWTKLGVASGLFLGMAISLIGGPYAPIIGASIILVTCAMQYYAEHYYLPKQEIRFSYDPLEELHNRLIKHCEDQISKLEKTINKCKVNTKEYDHTEYKLSCYEKIEQQLKQWQNSNYRNPDQLHDILQNIMLTSQIQRKRNYTPASAKELKNILRVFDAHWEIKKYKTLDNNDNGNLIENKFKHSIRSFVDNRLYQSQPANHFLEQDQKQQLRFESIPDTV